MLRIPPELHAEIAMRAEASGKSLNQWAAETLSHAQLRGERLEKGAASEPICVLRRKYLFAAKQQQ